jgi:hypothetical protein
MTTILQAIRDERLLAHAFKPKGIFKTDTWAAWRSFYSAAFSLPFESPAAFETYKRCTGRTLAPSQPFQEIICICGRRAGKSHSVACIAAFLATCRNYEAYLSPGERGVLAILAADKAQASVLMSYTRNFIASSPALSNLVVSETKESISLSNNVDIEIFAADAGGVRGRTLIGCLVDEGVFVNDIEEVLRALRPALTTIPGAPLILISSPWRKSGYVYSQFEKHFGKDSADVLIWKAPTKVMNPRISSARILAALATDKTASRTEFLAEWRDDLNSFLSEEIVGAAIVSGRRVLPYKKEFNYVAYVDVSGGRADALALSICHRDPATERVVQDLLFERVPPFSPQDAIAEAVQFLRHFHITEVSGDKYAAGFTVTAFESNGIQYRASDRDTSANYLSALPLFTSNAIELLDNPKLRRELLGLERKAGRLRDVVDHAPGQHDDSACATCGSLVLAAANERIYGVLKLMEKGWDGFADSGAVAETQAPRESMAVRQIRIMREMLQRRRQYVPPPPNPAFEPERPAPCDKCGSDCVVRIGLAEHCNSCASDRFREPHKVVVIGRDGYHTRQL